MNDAVYHTVNGLIRRFGCHVIQQQNGGAKTRKIMLQRKKLPPVEKRALRKQADLRQTVQHDTAWPSTFKDLDDQLDRFTELKVR